MLGHENYVLIVFSIRHMLLLQGQKSASEVLRTSIHNADFILVHHRVWTIRFRMCSLYIQVHIMICNEWLSPRNSMKHHFYIFCVRYFVIDICQSIM